MLTRWADKEVGKPFIWGETDCGSLTRRAHVAMFGRDVFPIPHWSSKREASSVLRKYGGVEDILKKQAVEDPQGLGFVQAGDVVVTSASKEVIGRRSLYVCLDGRRCLAANREKVTIIDLRTIPKSMKKRARVYRLREVHIG